MDASKIRETLSTITITLMIDTVRNFNFFFFTMCYIWCNWF